MQPVSNPIFSGGVWSLPSVSAQTKALGILCIAIIVWGGNWPVMKSGLNHISPLWFSLLRFALGGATLFAFQIMTGTLYRPKLSDLPLILSIGLLQMMTFTVLGSIAMTSVDAGRSAILAYTTTLWVLPMSVIFFRESLSKNQLLAAFLGLLGVLVLFNPLTFDWSSPQLLIANALLLLAALCWGVSILHLSYSKSKASAYQLAPWQMLTATIPLLFISYGFEGDFTGDGSVSLWLICIYLGPFATAFGFCAVNGASRVLKGTFISSAMLGVPVMGIFFSSVFLNERLSLSLICGAGLICAGIFLLIVNKKKT